MKENFMTYRNFVKVIYMEGRVYISSPMWKSFLLSALSLQNFFIFDSAWKHKIKQKTQKQIYE